MKILKIDKFYLVLVTMLIFLALVAFFTLKTIFGSINKAREIDTTIIPQDQNITINGSSLDYATKLVFQKNFTPLDLK